MPNDRAYWGKVHSYRRNVKTFGKYPKEVPRGVAKLPNLGKQPEKEPIEKELPYCPPAKAPQPSPERFKRQLRVGTRYDVSNSEWCYRHWFERVLDETPNGCEYCGSKENLTAVAFPGITMEDATMATMCVMCQDCIIDYLDV